MRFNSDKIRFEICAINLYNKNATAMASFEPGQGRKTAALTRQYHVR